MKNIFFYFILSIASLIFGAFLGVSFSSKCPEPIIPMPTSISSTIPVLQASEKPYCSEQEKLLLGRIWIDSQKIPYTGYIFTNESAKDSYIGSNSAIGYFVSVDVSGLVKIKPFVYESSHIWVSIDDHKCLYYWMKKENCGQFDLSLKLENDPQFPNAANHVYYANIENNKCIPAVLNCLLKNKEK